MSQTIQVRKIETPADFKAFFKFPWTHYASDSNWVPPLLSMRKELLDKEKNPAWEYMEGDYFGAWKGDTMVGTIVALINHRHNEFHDERIGFFGLFETINDQDVADALLRTTADWVKDKGYDAIRGPASFNTNEECGLLIDNFSPPITLMPYNPPYYQNLVEEAGFEKVMDVHSLYIDRDLARENNTIERFERIVSRATKRSNLVVRQLNPRRKKEEFKVFKELYNSAWEKNWGFVPMTDKELDALVASLGMLVDPKMAFFAEVDGEPAGFNLSIPNFNEALHRAYPKPGTPELITLAKAGWHWKIAKTIKGVRTPLMGVKAEYRNMGVDLALHYALTKALMPSQYEYIDSGWILETNKLIKIGESLGNKIYKTYRFYEKALN